MKLRNRAPISAAVATAFFVLSLLPAISQGATSAASRWLERLRSDSPSERVDAMYGSLQVDGTDQVAQAVFLSALEDSDPFVRRNLVSMLGELRLPPPKFIPHLISAMSDPDEGVSTHAAIALGKIGGPAAPYLVHALIKGLESKEKPTPPDDIADSLVLVDWNEDLGEQRVDLRLADYATFALIEIGPPAIPALLEAKVADDPLLFDYLAFIASGTMPDSLKPLTDGLTADDALVRSLAARLINEVYEDRSLWWQRVSAMGDQSSITIRRLVDTIEDPVSAVRKHAVQALGAIGKTSAPGSGALVKALNDPDPSVRTAGIKALYSIGFEDDHSVASALLKALDDPAVGVRAAAAESWKSTAAPSLAQSASSKLVQLLHDRTERVRFAASRGLGRIGKTAVPGVTAALGSRSEGTRSAAVRALGAMGFDYRSRPQQGKESSAPFARDIISTLGTALEDNVVAVRQEAVKSLRAWSRSEGELVVPLLVKALEDPDPSVRKDAAKELEYVRPTTEDAVDALGKHLDDPDRKVRQASAQALTKFEKKANLLLAHALGNDDVQVRRLAAEHFVRNKTKNKETLSALVRVTGDEDAKVRMAALRAMGKNDAADLAKTAIRSLQDVDPYVRREAVLQLSEVKEDATSAIPHLISALGDRDSQVSKSAWIAFRRIGAPSLPALIGATRHEDPQVRLNAVNALGNMSKPAASGVKALEHLLSDPEKSVRVEAVKALRGFGPAAIPALINAMENEYPGVRRHAISGLRSAAIPDKARVERPLIRALKDQDSSVRARAAYSLAYLGLGLDEIAQTAVQDESVEVRKEFVAGLAKCRCGNAIVVSVLQQALADPDAEVREQAIKSVVSLDLPPVTKSSLIRRKLVDPDESVRFVAAQSLSDLGMPLAVDNKLLLKILTAMAAEEYATDRLDRISGYLHPFGQPPVYSPSWETHIPPLPKPLPRYSAFYKVARHLLGNDSDTLGMIYERLQYSMIEAGFSEQGIFGMQDGFALVTRVERFKKDGSSSYGNSRWTKSKLPLRRFTLIEYLARLFMENPGEFRLFMLLVTPLNHIETSDKPLPEKSARQLVSKGGFDLPDEIGRLPFAGKKCYILVYHFRKSASEPAKVMLPSDLDGRAHIQRSGILAALNTETDRSGL